MTLPDDKCSPTMKEYASVFLSFFYYLLYIKLEFARNLSTDDIPGAKHGTSTNPSLNNLMKARSL